MKIGIVYLGRRGAGAVIAYEMAQHLSRKADVVSVISSLADNIGLWRKSNLQVVETKTFDGWSSAFTSMLKVNRLRSLAENIRVCRPDVLVFPMFHLWNPGLQQFLAEIPSIVFVHDPSPHPGLLPAMIRPIENNSFSRARRCVMFSSILVNDLRARGVPAEKIDVIPLGEMSYYQKLSLPSNPEEIRTKKKLLFFGRITRYKGLEILLKAFLSLANREDVELVIAGEGDLSRYSGLLKRFNNIRLMNRFIPEQEVAEIFNDSDIVVLPYMSATQSGVIPLAAAFGLPVIATRVGGIPEQIVDNVSGMLIEPGSVEQLAAGMERLLESPSERRRLGQNLYQDYRDNKNWSLAAQKVLEICREVAQ